MRAWQRNEIRAALSDCQADDSVLELRSLLVQAESFFPPLASRAAIGLLGHLDQLFITHPPEVKGVWLAGGVMTHGDSGRLFSVTGTGFSPADSLPGLIGEITEAIALTHDNHAGINCVHTVTEDAVLSNATNIQLAALRKFQTVSDRMLAITHLATGDIAAFPEALCLGKLPMPDSLPPQSEGCAAHVSQNAALVSALCEKVERDAVAHWWFAAKQPCKLTTSDEAAFASYSAACQCLESKRTSVLLNISHREWAPMVFAALSFDSRDGKSLAMGFGCSLTANNAIARAVLELRQMEMSLSLAVHRQQQQGSGVLDSKQIDVIQRAEQIDVHQHNLLAVERDSAELRHWDKLTAVTSIARDALQAGVDLYYVPLNVDELPLNVVKVVSAELLSPVKGAVSNLVKFRDATIEINPL